jgi:hypothetical protein
VNRFDDPEKNTAYRLKFLDGLHWGVPVRSPRR